MSSGYEKFTHDFCRDVTSDCLNSIKNAETFNLVAINGVGITFYIKFLETKSRDQFVLINTYEMPEFTKEAFYSQLVLKLGGKPSVSIQDNILQIRDLIKHSLSKSRRKIVFVINRFDRLIRILDQTFFDNLRFFRDQDRSRIVMIFVSSQKVIEVRSHEIRDILALFSKTIYFKPYSSEELRQILKLTPTNIIEKSTIVLSGGHHNLYNVLTRCQSLDNALSDPMVELLIKDMYFALNQKRRDDLDRLVKRNKLTNDEYLLGIGLVKQTALNKQDTFSPLLSEYIREETGNVLPVMEQKLLDFLYSNKGKVVSKEAIFDNIWDMQNGIASEWSLNSLIYRLRNHAGFESNRFLIKSIKKKGYVLYDSHDEINHY